MRLCLVCNLQKIALCKEGESPKDIKQLSDLIGTEFALALPYESEGKTGQYVFRLKIKNVGSRVSYF